MNMHLEQLAAIAQPHYVIVAEIGTARSKILASSLEATSRNDLDTACRTARDVDLAWLKDNLGATTVDKPGPLLSSLIGAPHVTLMSCLQDGVRVCAIVGHSADALSEEEVRVVTAVSLVELAGFEFSEQIELSQKEVVYLEHVCQGKKDEDIASELRLSLRAIKERKRKAIDDMKADNIAHAVGKAKRAGLI